MKELFWKKPCLVRHFRVAKTLWLVVTFASGKYTIETQAIHNAAHVNIFMAHPCHTKTIYFTSLSIQCNRISNALLLLCLEWGCIWWDWPFPYSRTWHHAGPLVVTYDYNKNLQKFASLPLNDYGKLRHKCNSDTSIFHPLQKFSYPRSLNWYALKNDKVTETCALITG